MKELVARARSAMNLILILSLATGWQVYKFSTQLNFEELIRTQFVEALSNVRNTKSLGSQDSLAYISNSGKLHFSLETILRLLSQIDTSRMKKLLNSGPLYEQLSTAQREIFAIRHALSDARSEHVNQISIDAVLFDAGKILPVAHTLANTKHSTLGLNLVHEINGAADRIEYRQSRLRFQIDKHGLRPYQNLGDLKNSLVTFVDVPFIEKNIQVKWAVGLISMFLLGVGFYLLSVLQAICSVLFKVRPDEGRDLIFLQSKLGYRIGMCWVSLPLVLLIILAGLAYEVEWEVTAGVAVVVIVYFSIVREIWSVARSMSLKSW